MLAVGGDVLTRARALNRARLVLARTQLDHFVEMCVKDDHGVLLTLAPLHRAWITHVNYCWTHGFRAMILAPFGSGKSSSLAVPLMAHLIGQDQNTRIKIVTNDDDTASDRLNAIRKMIRSRVYQQVFPKVKQGDIWTGHKLYVNRVGHSIDPTVHARGVLTTGIGGRADVMLFDDVVDQKNSTDALQRRRVHSLIEQTWLSRLEPDGHALLVGTCWHQDDSMHHLMQKPRWCTLIQRVSDDCTQILQEVVGGRDDYPGLGWMP